MAGYAGKIMDRFPSFMRTELRGKAMTDVAAGLGGQLDEAERLTNAIQRAHRIAVAGEESDVLHLASMAGLERADFFILRKFYENGYFALTEKDVAVTFSGGAAGLDFTIKITTLGKLDDIKTEIAGKLQELVTPPREVVAARDIVNQLGRSRLFRLRNVALVAARSGGQAKLSRAAVTLGAPQDRYDLEQRAYDAYLGRLRDSVERVTGILLDGCGTIHALLEGAAVLLNSRPAGDVKHTDAGKPRGGFIHQLPATFSVLQDGQPVEKDLSIYLVENPMVEKSTDDKERRQREEFNVRRLGFFTQPVSVKITGKADRAVLPCVINETAREGVGFRKAIKDGQVLMFSSDGKVSLDGVDVTASAYYFRGALFDHAKSDSTAPGDIFAVATPPGSLDRNYPRPAITPAARLPVMTVPLGDSAWRFSVAEGAFDASGFDEAVFAGPDPAPSAKVQLVWKEEKPFSVLLLIPQELKPLEKSVLEGADLRKLLRAGLERFRTAGIELQVDYFDPSWIAEKNVPQ